MASVFELMLIFHFRAGILAVCVCVSMCSILPSVRALTIYSDEKLNIFSAQPIITFR